VINVYVPNGGEVDGPRYGYKLDWLARLRAHLDQHHTKSDPLVICGDFNVALDDRDVYDPEGHRGEILCSEPERAAMTNLIEFGLTDLHRKFVSEGGIYTWWDYRSLGFPKNKGFRIDLFLATEPLASRCSGVVIDREERKGAKPSDHAPVRAEFEK
jgi:exodeoxyribonuclease-3